MKIKKFNESTQPSWKGYYVFSIADDISSKDFTIDNYLFDNEEAAFNFLVNRMYDKYLHQEMNLDELDDIIVDFKSSGFPFDIESLYNEYIDIIDKNGYFDNISLDYLEPNNKQDLEDWVKKRIELKSTSKKFNL